MKIFFYCSYEHSLKGFFMTQLEGASLVPAKDIPNEVYEFFSYDRYQVLWRDQPSKEGWSRKHRGTEGSFFGIRNISGKNPENRGFVINLCVLASKEEESCLRRMALSVLGDLSGFERLLLSWMKVGGACSYELNAEAFYKWLDARTRCSQFVPLGMDRAAFKKLLPSLVRADEPKKEKDLLRLAVYTSSPDDIVGLMGDSRVWRSRLPNVIGTSEFTALFRGEKPLWEIK